MGFPTPYAEVNEVLLDLLTCIQTILGDQLVGLYLYGSLALGDFDPQSSDIDFIVVTRSELSAEQIDALRTIHMKFDQSGSAWGGKVEAAYIPLKALKQPAPQTTIYPQVERGQELFLAPLEAGWVFQRFTLRERGVVVLGPSPVTFTDPVNQAEMQRAAIGILSDWQEKGRHDPEWIAWVQKRASQAFVILTTCRLLYSLETGSVASKPAAAAWAKNISLPSHATLIERAFVGQHDEQEISDIELADSFKFLDEALNWIQEIKP